MTKFVSLPFNKKLNLLRAHSVGCDWPDLDQEQWCLHCGKSFNGHMVRVWQDPEGALWLECGTPKCSGSPIDWAPYPWWNPKHPATKRYLKESKTKARRKSGKQPGMADDDVPF
ncbi:MAG TPA: hypothetical protein VJA21_10195 [Verrucomicrobiae bacterium]